MPDFDRCVTYALPVPTGGNPATAIDRALTRLGPLYGDIGVDVEHDTGCPSIGLDGGLGTAACTCEVVRLVLPELGGPCDGGFSCAATVHIHGCFADRGNCDNPSEHPVA